MSAEPQSAEGWSRVDSFAWVALAYLLALAAALLFVADATRPIAALFAAFTASTLVVFGFSTRFDNGSFFDPYWSVAPPFVCLFWIGQSIDAPAMRQVLVTALVFAWGVRLTWNWARGWSGLAHEDWRYVDLYAQAPAPKWVVGLIAVHLVPMLFVFLSCLSLIPALAGGRAVGALDCLALIVTGGAILIETVADEQMRAFARAKQSGEIMASGLWSRSRHPNYLGEIGFWWGLFLFGSAADPGWWWTIVGPLAITALFHFASVPLLDRRSLARRPGYAEHMARVNAIVPGRRRFPRPR